MFRRYVTWQSSGRFGVTSIFRAWWLCEVSWKRMLLQLCYNKFENNSTRDWRGGHGSKNQWRASTWSWNRQNDGFFEVLEMMHYALDSPSTPSNADVASGYLMYISWQWIPGRRPSKYIICTISIGSEKDYPQRFVPLSNRKSFHTSTRKLQVRTSTLIKYHFVENSLFHEEASSLLMKIREMFLSPLLPVSLDY